jgi:two-component sensor histidine kinase
VDRLVPTWRLLNELPIRSGAMVPIERVFRQRQALSEIGVAAARQVALTDLLEHAVQQAADGVESEMAKILALQPDGNLLVIAGKNLKPGVAGVALIPGDRSNPAGECVSEERIVNIPDLRACPQYDLPSIYPEHAVVSTVNIPIMLSSGPFGILEIDSVQPRVFDELDLSFLIGIAGVIGEGVARVRREAALNEQLSTRDILLREHHHRVRNQYQLLTSVLDRHARQAGTPESRERFLAVERRVFALASLYDHLLGVDQHGTVILQDYLESLCVSLREFYTTPEHHIAIAFHRTGEVTAPIDVASTLGLIVNELVANSVEHAFRHPFPRDGSGEVRVGVEREQDGGTRIVVSDNGVGYRPDADDAFGMTTARRLVEQIGASVERSSERVTKWEIRVPPSAFQVSAFQASALPEAAPPGAPTPG